MSSFSHLIVPNWDWLRPLECARRRGAPAAMGEVVAVSAPAVASRALLAPPVAHVVTYRNNLNKICGTPAAPRDAWAVDAVLLGGVMFLDIVKTPQGDGAGCWGGAPQHQSQQDLQTYYGYKFESVCSHKGPAGAGAGTGTATGREGAPGPAPTVDATSEYATVVRFCLGGLAVVMAAEIDMQDPKGRHVVSCSGSTVMWSGRFIGQGVSRRVVPASWITLSLKLCVETVLLLV
jgi:hypothetical protein